MGFLDSKLYRVLDVLGSFILLNLLWLVLCIPLITAFPATAAMFAVVRDWTRDRDEYSLGRFFPHMRANFAQSLAVGVVWSVLGGVLSADYFALSGMDGSLKLLLSVLLALVTLVYTFASIYLFPVMVNYNLGWRVVIRNSFFIAFGQLGTTLLSFLLIVLAAILLLILPLSILLLGSVTAYLLYLMCQRAFTRIEGLRRKT